MKFSSASTSTIYGEDVLDAVGSSGSGESPCTLASSQIDAAPADMTDGEGAIVPRDLLKRRLPLLTALAVDGETGTSGRVILGISTFVLEVFGLFIPVPKVSAVADACGAGSCLRDLLASSKLFLLFSRMLRYPRDMRVLSFVSEFTLLNAMAERRRSSRSAAKVATGPGAAVRGRRLEACRFRGPRTGDIREPGVRGRVNSVADERTGVGRVGEPGLHGSWMGLSEGDVARGLARYVGVEDSGHCRCGVEFAVNMFGALGSYRELPKTSESRSP
jgi:hypothetical protein